jgi:hypothetical protein
MKTVALALAFLVLAACEDGSTTLNLNIVEQQCGVADRPFDASWPWVRTAWAGIDDGYPGVRDQYLATGDVVAERVRAGQMTQAEARLAMQRARSEARAATTSPRAVVYLPFNGMIVCR